MNFDNLITLVESPVFLTDVDSRITDRSHLASANRDKELFVNEENKIADLKIKNLDIEVYSFNIPGSKEIEFYFTLDKEIIALYVGERAKKGLITQLVESKAKLLPNDSFVGELYINFLLPRFNFIMSDMQLTQLGFGFWLNNFDKFENNGYKIYACDMSTKSKKLLTDKKQLKQYFGKDDLSASMNKKHYHIYRFVVSRY